jgi:hypothetical protein
VRQTKIDHEQIEVREIGPHAREQLHRALDRNRPMAGGLERGLETIPDERRVVGNQDGFG